MSIEPRHLTTMRFVKSAIDELPIRKGNNPNGANLVNLCLPPNPLHTTTYKHILLHTNANYC